MFEQTTEPSYGNIVVHLKLLEGFDILIGLTEHIIKTRIEHLYQCWHFLRSKSLYSIRIILHFSISSIFYYIGYKSKHSKELDELISFIKISFIPSRKGLDTTILIQINSSRVTTRIFKVILILRWSAHWCSSKVGNGNK